MEQRIGSKSQPLDAAAVNPAYVPGLTSPVSADLKKAKPEDSAEPEESVEPDEAAPAEDEVSEEAPAEVEEASAEAEETSPEEEDEEEAVEGPVFEASDRRARMIADHRGVRLFLDDQECEFRWDEIGAVETETPRFGKRFTITVYTPEKRWYPIEIEASARSRFQEWESELDAVLDAYFEDGDSQDADAEADAETETEADAEAEVETKAEDDEA
ncbi:hypothetical protein [Streptomyces sp. NPDC005485]|uniref:hypothetical protein n=1 Tax=Streptomyces sp. NPDC005485 TaxID=3155591 RepID=UPI00339E7AF3